MKKKAVDKRQGWLLKLKVGDKVIVSNWGNRRVETVKKITPTGRIHVTVGVTTEMFNPDGYNRGTKWNGRDCLEEATPERLEDIRVKDRTGTLKFQISQVTDRFFNLEISLDDLEAVWKILEKYQK